MIVTQISKGLYEARQGQTVAYAEYMSIAVLECARMQEQMSERYTMRCIVSPKPIPTTPTKERLGK